MIENSYKQGYWLWLTAVIVVSSSSCHLITANIDGTGAGTGTATGTGTDSCWINDETCLVHATLHKTNMNGELEINRDKLPMDIDCAITKNDSANSSSSSVTQPPEYLLNRFKHAFGLTLNGCHKGLKWHTFGFEFLPNCDRITEIVVEQFNADTLYPLQCTKATFIQLEFLYFKHNEISTITAEALSNLSLLRELHFVSNALRHIEENSFDNLHFIERFHMENEPLLVIKDPYLFKHTNVADLTLINLKHVTSSLFENLPETLMNLTISRTSIDIAMEDTEASARVSVLVNNSRLLRNVTINDCNLSVFKLNDIHGSVLYLNLSGNRLTDIEIQTNHTNVTSELEILDLSNNELSFLPVQLLQPYILDRLQQLHLQRNFLKQLPFVTLLDALPAIQYIDLSVNQLEQLSVMDAQLETAVSRQMRIRIDGNPWSCKWLLNFAHAHPDTFRVFQYEKFLAQINVNGLACTPAIAGTLETTTSTLTSPVTVVSNYSRDSSINANDMYLNISTFTLIYGSPWDVKRNQRTEALIIVFMLPVGIAILFLLLYLWIYCQKVFHLSFYQKCPLLNRKRQRGQSQALVTNRFDVVRQLPPNNNAVTTIIGNNEGYEIPLNGVTPICNCVHNDVNSSYNTPNLTNEKCRKLNHITYVPLPDDRSQQIYEEIIGSEEDLRNLGDQMRSLHPIYDHLTFENEVIEKR